MQSTLSICCTHYLYEKKCIFLSKSIKTLFIDNLIIQGINTRDKNTYYIYYHNEKYNNSYCLSTLDGKNTNYPAGYISVMLHLSIKKTFMELVKEIEELQEEMTIMRNFFKTLTSLSLAKKDLSKLLPNIMLQDITIVWPNSPDAYPDEYIEKLQIKYKKYTNIAKERLLYLFLEN